MQVAPHDQFLSNSLPIAMVDKDRTQWQACYDPALQGHSWIFFDNTVDLLHALRSGKRVALLLVVLHADTVWDDLISVCVAADAPLMLGVPDMKLVEAPEMLFNRFREKTVDLIVWPYAAQELAYRIHLVQLRARAASEGVERSFGDFRFLPDLHVVQHKGKEIHMQPQRFDLALMLFQNLGETLSRETLWRTLWGREPLDNERKLDVCIAGVRKDLDLRLETGFVLRCVYRHGYRLDGAHKTSVSIHKQDGNSSSKRGKDEPLRQLNSELE